MKYIRTKDGIEIVNLICYDKKHYCDSDWRIVEIGNNKIADTIEELCDEYVVIDSHEKAHITPLEDIMFNKTFEIRQVYGAIWTSRGLIYVATMNEKGELELL